MIGLELILLFVGAAVAHSGLKSIVVDGTVYPPFNEKIDHLLGDVKRVEWSHDIVVTAYNPTTNLSDPALTCQPNARAPLLKAKARAGADVTLQWTKIVRMHQGPILAYLGYLPTPDTKPQDVKFFKIWEQGFDASKGEWANQIAVDNGNQYTVKIPSDIKSGTYVLRTELIALHGNMANLKNTSLAGPQFYPYCFNIDVVSSGSAVPEGVNIPGAYKLDDYGVAFSPYMTYTETDTKAGTVQNSKYVPPGPPLYKGKYEAPTGPIPVVTETGAYTPELQVQYNSLVQELSAGGNKLADFVNAAWPGYKPDAVAFKAYTGMVKEEGKQGKALVDSLMGKISAFKKASQVVVKRWVG